MGAKNDLRRMLTRRARIDPHPGGPAPSPSNALARRSAVLILAGARETILAPGASAEDAVPADTDILLTIRSTELRHHPGQVAFPGGGIEGGDDSAAAAALREAREETGIAPESVEILGSLPEIMLPASGNLVTPVLGWWSRPGALLVDGVETADAMRVAVAALIDPASRWTSVLRRNGSVHRGPAFRSATGAAVIWGFTGRLLATVLDGAGWAQPWDETREITIDDRVPRVPGTGGTTGPRRTDQ